MICNPCKKAGEINTEFNRVTETGTGLGKNIRDLAVNTHKDCPGLNWCDCQHYVGQALNLTLLGFTTVPAVMSADVLEPVELCSSFRQSRNVMYADSLLVRLS